MKYAWIAKQKDYTLKGMCGVLEVSISGFRARARGGRAERKRLTDPIADARADPIFMLSLKAPTVYQRFPSQQNGWNA